MILQILNWNTALTEHNEHAENIFDYIFRFLEKTNAVAVLQQIPYKAPENHWAQHDVFTKLQERCSGRIQMIHNGHFNNGYVYMETVILTNIADAVPAVTDCYPESCPTNREAAVVIRTGERELTILGIHAKNGKDNAGYLKALRSNPSDLILGDFNAGDYPDSENQALFRSIPEQHVCVCNLPTKRVMNRAGFVTRETCIDHVLVKQEYVTACKAVTVDRNMTISDHYPVLIRMEL